MNSSISNPISLNDLHSQKNELNERLKQLRSEVIAVYEILEKTKRTEKALENFHRAIDAVEIQELAPSEHKRRRFQAISDEVKALVVDNVLYKGSMSWKDAEKAFDISRSSIARILKAERKRKAEGPPLDHPNPKKKRGRKSPLTEEILIFILSRLEENSQLTLRDMVKMCEETFQIQTSEDAISHALEKMQITWKNVLPIPSNWNTPQIIDARTKFCGSTLPQIEMQGRSMIYIDESGFNMHVKKSKGRALKGEPARLTLVPKGKRITLIGALSKDGMVHYQLLQHHLGTEKRGTNAEDFRSFILDLIKKIPSNSVLLMDNAKIHHADKVQDLWDIIKKAYNIDVVYLPPYSPFLNPIEYAFNDIKIGVAAASFTNQGELMEAIKNQLTQISTTKAQNFVAHTKKYHSQALVGLPFRGKPLNPEIPELSTSSSLIVQ